MMAAAEKNLPMFVPGWEDSTLGNMFAAQVIGGNVKNATTMRGGIEYMIELARWYTETATKTPIGFFQIGGGIAGDFPICVVPMLHQDLQARQTSRSGAISARSAIRPPATAPIPAPSPTKKSPGASSASTLRASSSNPTPPSSPRSCSRTSLGGKGSRRSARCKYPLCALCGLSVLCVESFRIFLCVSAVNLQVLSGRANRPSVTPC